MTVMEGTAPFCSMWVGKPTLARMTIGITGGFENPTSPALITRKPDGADREHKQADRETKIR